MTDPGSFVLKRALPPLIAIALFGAPLSSLGDASWYGSIRTYLSYRDEPDQEGVAQKYWDIRNYGSRFGVHGRNALGDGLAADYGLEFAVLSDKAQLDKQGRLSYVGLSGRLGSLHIGQQWSPRFNATFLNFDVFNSFSPVFYQGDFRLSNMLRYTAPVSPGNLAQVAVIVDGDNDSDNIDAGILGLKGGWKGLTGAFGYNRTALDDRYTSELTLGYDFGNNSQLWLNREDSNQPDGSGRIYRILGALGLGHHILRALYSDADEIGEKAIQLGWQYKLSNTSRVAIEWQSLSQNTGTDVSLLNFALRTDF